MTARDERLLLRAVARHPEGAWLCEVKAQIPATSGARVLAGLHALRRERLLILSVGAYRMGTWRLSADGKTRLWRGRPRERMKVAA